jgi:hypothetical protein
MARTESIQWLTAADKRKGSTCNPGQEKQVQN